MRTYMIPTDIAFAVSLILASHGFTTLTAPKSLVERAVQQVMAMGQSVARG